MNEEALLRAQVLAQLGCWQWDLSTGRLDFTEEMYRLVGLWPDARPLTYRDYLRFVHPGDRHLVNSRIRRALQGRPFRTDHRLRLLDGRVRWVHCEGEVRFDREGRPLQMLGTALDVTGQRRGLAQLEGGDRLFRVLVENSQDVIFRYRVEPDQGFDYLSPAAGYYTGLAPEEIYSDPEVFFARVHPDDLPLVARAIADPENNSPYQIRVLGRGGKWLWAEQVLVPIRDEDGKLIAIEGISRDVTSRKEAEAEREALLRRLEDERRWLEIVTAQLPGALVLVRLVDGKKVVTANGAARGLCGAALDCEILDAAGAPLADEQLLGQRALRGEAVPPREYRLRRTDGGEVSVLGSASPIRDAQQQVVGAVILWEDLTTIKEVERMREEWTSVVAHELRQPITLIRTYAELVSRQLGEESHRCRVEQIGDASRRLGRMIEDLLDVSRIEAHRLSLERRAVNVTAWAQEVIDGAMRQFPDTQMDLKVAGTTGSAVIDPDRMEQVLMNLLCNATKYGAQGAPIEVELAGTDRAFTVAVRSRGEPIPADQLPRLFGRFHRVQRPDEPKVAGTGLGLYIAKGLVEAHGGEIRAVSDPAGFNTFSFEIPWLPPGDGHGEGGRA